MISSPQPNEATANSNANSQSIPTPTLPNIALENSHFLREQHVERLYENGQAGRGSTQLRRGNWWQRLSLRTKATTLAIALSTIPVLVVGTIDYFLSSKDIREDTIEAQRTLAISLGDGIGRFMFERYADIQTLSGLRAFSDPRGSQITTRQEKEAQLNRFVEVYQLYDNIAVFNLNGNVIAQSQGEASRSIKNEDYFQTAIKTDRAFISQPTVSKVTGKNSIYMVAPVKDITTGKTIAVMRTRMPVNYLEELLQIEEEKLVKSAKAFAEDNYHLIDANGKIFVANEEEKLGRDVSAEFPSFAQIHVAKKVAARLTDEHMGGTRQLVAYAPVEQIEGMPELSWSILLSEDINLAFAAQRRLLLTLLLGTGLTALVVAAIAAYLANRATRPIVNAAGAVEKLGQGELDTRVAVKGQDELATLGSNINRMAEQMQTLLVEQEEATRRQLAAQEEIARTQAKNAEQQRLAKEQLQKRALDLLMEVEPISSGDLTIRAKVTEDEIGTIADSYNATVGRLRKIVTQVQAAAQQVAATTSTSEASVSELSKEALRQTEEIAAALDRIQEMSNSIRAVAANAQQAEAAVQQSTQTVEEGDAAMNRTVDGIVALRETVAETSKKVQQLGESSQKISKVVKLIGTFAAQTNLLALKASIEAARAGEEGRGFAVIADEVRALASQSALATAEIESLVAAIQTETNEVVAAMEAGTLQVVEGTKLVDETRTSLNKITAASAQIGALVEAIAAAAVAQSQTSFEVTQTISDVAAIANKTSIEATQVSASFKELLEVATELQASATQFKVS